MSGASNVRPSDVLKDPSADQPTDAAFVRPVESVGRRGSCLGGAVGGRFGQLDSKQGNDKVGVSRRRPPFLFRYRVRSETRAVATVVGWCHGSRPVDGRLSRRYVEETSGESSVSL